MKLRCLALVILVPLLLGGCARIFDGIIEVLYRDDIEKYQTVQVGIHVRIDEAVWTVAEQEEASLKVALVPYFEVSGGFMPDWSQRLERELQWSALQSDSTGRLLSTSFDVVQGFSYRLVAWQPRSGDASVVTIDDPATTLPFYFGSAYGSDDYLTSENIKSEPYADGYLMVTDRLPDYLIAQFSGKPQGESAYFDAWGPVTIDTRELPTASTFGVSRSGSNLKGVAAILIQRRMYEGGGVNVIAPESASGDWERYSIDSSEAYSSYYEGGLSFDDLLNRNSGEAYSVRQGTSMELAVKLEWLDGGYSDLDYLHVGFFDSEASPMPSGKSFNLSLQVYRGEEDFAGKGVFVYLRDEGGVLLNSGYPIGLGSTDASGRLNVELLGAQNWPATVTGGHYSAQVVVDINANSAPDGGDQYAYYPDIEVFGPESASVYEEALVADDRVYWYMF